MKKPTYTATFDDNGEVIFEHRNRGPRYDLFPKGSQMKSFAETGDGWNGAHGVTPSGRAFTIRRDNKIPAPVRPVANVSHAGTGKEAHTPGPWGLQALTTNQHGYADWPVFCIRSGGSNIGGNCLAVVGEVDRFTAPKNEANARLMAAAPALLAACKAALAYLADPPSEFAENRAAAVELIRAALAAATESEGA